MNLKTGRTEIGINEENGAIVCVKDTITGLSHITSNPDGLLFRIIVPHGIWSSRYVSNTSAKPHVVHRNDDEILLRWKNLPAADGPSGVNVDARFWTEPATGEVRVTLTIRNDGPDPVIDVQGPALAGWCGQGGQGHDTLVLGGHIARDPHRFPKTTGTTYGEFFQKDRAEYPTDLYAPWADLSGPAGGISFVGYMDTPKNMTFFEYNMAGHDPGYRLAFGWRTPCVLQPGETLTTIPFGISVHDSDWHVTADRYIDWVDSWFVAPPGKKHLREMIGFQNVWLSGFDGTPFYRIEEIPRIAADGLKYGVDHLCLWDEVMNGLYNRRIDNRDLMEYTPEETAALKAAMKEVKAMGVNANALMNFRLIPGSPAFADDRREEFLRYFDGSPRTEMYAGSHTSLCGWENHGGPNNYIASPFSEAYRKRVMDWTQQYIDLGFVSMFFDQPFETCPDYGRLAEGCRPEDTYQAVMSLVAQVRQELLANDAEAYLIGEYCEAFMGQYIDLWMSWYPEMQQALYSAYSIPQTMQSWVVDRDSAQASRAFAIGMQLCLCNRGNEGLLSETPEFAEHVSRLAALRKRTADRTVHARFRDHQGLTIKTSGDAGTYAFDGQDGPSVILCAPADGDAVSVSVDRGAFSQPGKPEDGRIIRLDGSETRVTGDTHHFELTANEVVVWTL